LGGEALLTAAAAELELLLLPILTAVFAFAVAGGVDIDAGPADVQVK
jgi:hypothetical protein